MTTEKICPNCREKDTITEDKNYYQCFMCEYKWRKRKKIKSLVMPK